MFKKIQYNIVSEINKVAFIKKKIIILINFYYKYSPFFIGWLIRIPAFIKHLLNSKVIAKPGTLSFNGGAFNPGALLLDGNNILLIAKAQFLPWFKARGHKNKFYMLGNPIVFLLNNKINTEESYIINDILGYPQNYNFALEDFRLFHWKDQKMVNHSYVIKDDVDGQVNQTSVKSALAVLDEKLKKLNFVAFPKVDFKIQKFEKNWIYKENGGKLLLFYSLDPYKVLELIDEKSFTFKTVINQNINNKVANPGGFDTMVSYSTNPIDYDDDHWFLVIHQIKMKITGRCYYHWGLLINKTSLLPVKITSRPIFSGMGARGRTPGIRYVSSVLKKEDKILFFAGEGDVFVTIISKNIQEINDLFTQV